MNFQSLILLFILIASSGKLQAQVDSIQIPNLTEIPAKYVKQVDKKVEVYHKRITGKTYKTLEKLSKWENKIHKALMKVDPALDAQLFGNSKYTFATLLAKVKEGEKIATKQKGHYDEYRDKLNTGFKYLEQQKDSLNNALVKPVQDVSKKLKDLEQKVQDVESVESLIKERRKELAKASLKMLGKNKYLNKISKEAWYYSETLKNYKDIFSEPAKAEKLAKEVLNKIPAYKSFIKKNSLLASMFKMPEDFGSAESLEGLQTRAGVNAIIQERIASGGPNAREAIAANMKQAQGELTKLKTELIKKAGGSGTTDIPGFKPNTQKTKTFKQRLEYGFNMQFGKSNSMLPTTSDIALTLGYKLNDKSVVGIGASYKMGIGSINKIRFSHEGLGLRSFIHWKLKKQFFVTGGFEANLNSGFKRVPGLEDYDEWQPVGVVGISKKVSIKSKISKGSKIQLLYTIPFTNSLSQPFIFRVGHTL